MIIECKKCKTKNQIESLIKFNGIYKCGFCKELLEIDYNLIEDDKMAGIKLAKIALSFCNDKIINEFLSQQTFSQEENDRFIFSLSILNISIAIWGANSNLIPHSSLRARTIINSAFDYYNDEVELKKQHICISDIIVDEKELDIFLNKYKFEPLTKTDYSTILSVVYQIRLVQYLDILRTITINLIKNEMDSFDWMSPLTKRFLVHFTGEEVDDQNISLSLVLLSIYEPVAKYIAKCT
jgi:hypothetical protein